MTSTIICPAISKLTEDNLTTLSMVFPRPARSQLIELRNILSNHRATFRTYREGTVTFDMDGLTKAVALKCPAKTVERLKQLVANGVCLQAIASTPLRIPLAGNEGISLTV